MIIITGMKQQQPNSQSRAVEQRQEFTEVPAPPIRYTSESLFHGRNEVLINHAGQEYRLRVTRQNRLILTK
jgi:hemin uptake protein HemP